MAKCEATRFALGPGLLAAGAISAVGNGLLQSAPGIGRAIGESIRDHRNIRRAAEWDAIFEEHRQKILDIDDALVAEVAKLTGIDGRLEKLRFRKLSLSRQFDLVEAELSGNDLPLVVEYRSENERIEAKARSARVELIESLFEVYDEARSIAVDDPVTAEGHLAGQINEAINEVEHFRVFVRSNIEKLNALEADCQAIQSNLGILKAIRDFS